MPPQDICVFKAASTAFNAARSIQITIDTEMPGLSVSDANRTMDIDALNLANVLHDCLPAGTWDRLLAQMLHLSASSMIISRKPEPVIIDQTADLIRACQAALEFIDELPWERQLPSLIHQLKKAVKAAEGE